MKLTRKGFERIFKSKLQGPFNKDFNLIEEGDFEALWENYIIDNVYKIPTKWLEFALGDECDFCWSNPVIEAMERQILENTLIV